MNDHVLGIDARHYIATDSIVYVEIPLIDDGATVIKLLGGHTVRLYGTDKKRFDKWWREYFSNSVGIVADEDEAEDG